MPLVGSLDVWLDVDDDPQQGTSQRQGQQPQQQAGGKSPFLNAYAGAGQREVPGNLRVAPASRVPKQGNAGQKPSSCRAEKDVSHSTVSNALGHVEALGSQFLTATGSGVASDSARSAQQPPLPPRRQYSLLSRQISQSVGSSEAGQPMGPQGATSSVPRMQPAAGDSAPSCAHASGSGATGPQSDPIRISISGVDPVATTAAPVTAPTTAAAPHPDRLPAAPDFQPSDTVTSAERHTSEAETQAAAAAARAWVARASALAPLTAAVCTSGSLIAAAAAGYASTAPEAGSGSGGSSDGGSLHADDSTGGSRRGDGGALYGSSSAASSEGGDACGALAAAVAMLSSDDSQSGGAGGGCLRQEWRAAAEHPEAGGIPCGRTQGGCGMWDTCSGGSAGGLLAGGRREGPARGGGRGGRGDGHHPSCASLPELPQRQGAGSSAALSGPLSASPRAPNGGSLSRTYATAAAPAGVGASLIAAATAASAATLSLPGLPIGRGLSPVGPEGTTPATAVDSVGLCALALTSPIRPLALPTPAPPRKQEGSALHRGAAAPAGPAPYEPCAAVDSAASVGDSAAAVAATTDDQDADVTLAFPTLAPPSPAPVAAAGLMCSTSRVAAVTGAAAGAAGASRATCAISIAAAVSGVERTASPPRFRSWPFAGEVASVFATALMAPDGRGASPRRSVDGSSADRYSGDGSSDSRGGAADGGVPSAFSYPPNGPGGPGGGGTYEGTMRGGCRRGTRRLSRLESAPAGSLLARLSQGGSLPDGS